MKKKLFFPLFLLLSIFTNCSKNSSGQELVLQGVTTTEDFYTDNSFFNKDTVVKTFTTNNLDFWFFVKGENKRDNSKLTKTISNLCKHFSHNKKMFMQQTVQFSEVTFNDVVTDTPLFYFPGNKGFVDVSKLPVAVREINPHIMFNTVSVDFEGKITSHFESYLEHLDRGFIAGASMTAEILGPEWKIDNSIRLYIKTPTKKNEDINEALIKRRTYISFERNTDIDFKIENSSIGDVIEKKQNIYNYSINIKQPNVKIGKVELVTNNERIIISYPNINSNIFSIKSNLSLDDAFNYVLLKIYFENGKVAYTTPIWIIKDKVISINNTNIKLEDAKGKLIKKICYNIENLTKEAIEKVSVKIYKKTGELVITDETTLKGRESKAREFRLDTDNTTDQELDLKVSVNGSYHTGDTVTLPGSNLKKILIDKLHSNEAVDNMTIFKKALDKAGYITTFADNISYQKEDILKSYNLFIVTAPGNISEDAFNEITYLYSIHKFVYEGGALLLAGTNDEKSRVSINYLNRILRILYSPVKYRFDEKAGVYPIYDETNNYSDKYLPVFTEFNSDVFSAGSVNKIYMRSPVEIFGQSGFGEVSLSNSYNTISLTRFSQTTAIENRKIYEPLNFTPAVIVKFGKGYICVLSGMNFGDYDIDNLDNKKWIMGIIDYITGKR